MLRISIFNIVMPGTATRFQSEHCEFLSSEGISYCSLLSTDTVDGRNPANHLGNKKLVNIGVNYQPQLVSLPDF